MTKETKLTVIRDDDFESVDATPYYTCTANGVYWHTFSVDSHGKVTENPAIRLADEIKLIGNGIDDNGEHYRVIEYTDKMTRERKKTALPFGEIGSNWAMLQRKGISIQSKRTNRDLLADYLQNDGSHTRHLITNQTGWIDTNRAYVMPSGEVLGNSEAKIIYNGDTSQAGYYTEKGTLSDWQQQIAHYASGNSRVMLALGASFAAPLMRLLDVEGGGFHLFGDSSDGKTTVAKVALSVWGKADDLKLSWEGTSHAFTNTANAKNDNFLVLDEVGQATTRTLSQTAYSVINGVGKAQGKKEGGNRHINRWRVLVLSTGEKTLEAFLQRGKTDFHAGQANRLPSIPANAGKELGVYDALHDMPNGAELSEHLGQASNRYYGTAGKAFINHLLDNLDDAINHVTETMDAFNASLPPMTGQTRRVANRFALVAGALELANHYGITGLTGGTASVAVKQCFDDWLAREGAGKFEDMRIIEQVTAFFEQYGDTERFLLWTDKNPPRDFVGYREEISDDFENVTHVDYWNMCSAFKKYICDGYDFSKVIEVLAGNGMLQRGNGKHVAKQRRVNKKLQRFYVVRIEAPTGDDEN